MAESAPKRRALKRKPREDLLEGELRATPISDTPTLFRLTWDRADGASTFLGLLEGSREQVAVAVHRLALRMKLRHLSGRRARDIAALTRRGTHGARNCRNRFTHH